MENKKVKQVDFIFENCEICSVDIGHILNIFTGAIQTNFHIQEKDVFQNWYTDYCKIVFKNVENKDVVYWTNEACKNDKIGSTKRLLEYNDVTHIDIIYEDGTNFYLAVPWKGRGYINHRQKYKRIKNNYVDYTISELVWSEQSIFTKIKSNISYFLETTFFNPIDRWNRNNNYKKALKALEKKKL
jgi:hypothetical protein